MSKVLYLATEDWFFCQHFLPMGRAAARAGFEVVVAARRSDAADRIIAEGFTFLECDNDRRSLGFVEMLRTVARIAAIVRAEKPDIVHCISLRMAVLGGAAARLTGAKKLILAPTGLGHLWLAQGTLVRVARFATRIIVGRILRRPGTHYLFENRDDPREFDLDPLGPHVTIVNGAGVDPAQFAPSPEPAAPPIKVAIVARMLKPKGIAEAVAATLRARERGAAVELHLFGMPDPANRQSLHQQDLQRWTAMPGIVWHGSTNDPAAVYRNHHIAMLLSYREGLPKTLVEAAAIGRPIVTTDVAGCRELIRDGVEGYLVQAGDVEGATLALTRLGADETRRARMGRAARQRFEERFTEEKVSSTISELYRHMFTHARRLA